VFCRQASLEALRTWPTQPERVLIARSRLPSFDRTGERVARFRSLTPDGLLVAGR